MDPVALAGSELKHIDRKYFQTPPMIPWGGAGWRTTTVPTNQH